MDDAVDETTGADAAGLVSEWRAELERCYRGMPLHPVTVALAASLEQFPIPKSALGAVIDGVEMDLVKRRYATFAELELYCWRAASAVGLASIEVFGYRNPGTRDYAVDVGLRCSSPTFYATSPKTASATASICLPRISTRSAFRPRTCCEASTTSASARSWNSRASEREATIAPRRQSCREKMAASLRPAEAMRQTYEAVLDRIVAERYFVFGRRLGLSRRRKVALAASMWVGSLLP